MLKSTYKPAFAQQALPLPDGWTEHKAPTGHAFYFNPSTRESTYVRPQAQVISDAKTATNAQPEIDAFTGSDKTAWQQSNSNSDGQAKSNHFQRSGHSNNMQNHGQRSQGRDRPKTSHIIPGCEPWLLVKTKIGRRFVHNTIENESFWKFPPDVLKGVVEHDRQEREKRQKIEHEASTEDDPAEFAVPESDSTSVPGASAMVLQSGPAGKDNAENELASDEEYEEVEVTDDEQETAKQNLNHDHEEPERALEFDEDDIAYQLAAMGNEYGLEPGEYGDHDGSGLEEGAEGLPLTEEDSNALFTDMLDDHRINPFTTWDALIEAGQIIEDDRYTVLPSMRSRKEVWGKWSKHRMQLIKEQREKEETKDPKIPYFAFLEARATPKLYWPEFRRKYQKEPVMRNSKLSDKDREKWYREYVNRLKLPENNLKSDFVQLLKSQPIHVLNMSTRIENLPTALLTDIRFVSLRASVRDPLMKAHISSLPPVPDSAEASPEQVVAAAKEKSNRERRELALAERQKRAQEEKRKQVGALHYGRGILREEEQQLERAMRVGKQGLLGHKQAQELEK
ncbi:uncharacterized protein KY384_002717 [Bacidia gigantensis]|uniref:uncharacterized protein n=1 Tax=Bacidia gigantensis TaxID=2732470 RepID=UPI001D041440|nr:uncharacterized protein KY384_002717 [Bacidia gigantensis]KAG8532839.1 hypothetical protein KY384_002717 [Bacidia gigantensis]